MVIIICIYFYSPNVVFCGYTMPHRAKDKVKFRIQTSRGSAEDVLKKGLKDLMKVLLLVKNKETTRSYKTFNICKQN